MCASLLGWCLHLLTASQSCSSMFSPIAANETGKNVGGEIANLHMGMLSNSLDAQAHAGDATLQSACHCAVIDLRCKQVNSFCDRMLLPSLLVRAVLNATEVFDNPGPTFCELPAHRDADEVHNRYEGHRRGTHLYQRHKSNSTTNRTKLAKGRPGVPWLS